MNFSKHQKQHLRQVITNLANLLSAAGREWRDTEMRGDPPPLYVYLLHSSELPESTFSKRQGEATS